MLLVLDGHPATLLWLGAVAGYRTLPLEIEDFGQKKTIGDLHVKYAVTHGVLAEETGNALPTRLEIAQSTLLQEVPDRSLDGGFA